MMLVLKIALGSEFVPQAKVLHCMTNVSPEMKKTTTGIAEREGEEGPGIKLHFYEY